MRVYENTQVLTYNINTILYILKKNHIDCNIDLRRKNELQKPLPTFYRDAIRGPRYEESLQPILNYPQGTVDTMLTGSINRPFSFARGGLSGGDTSGPPPESGPMSQGLRSLYKNGRKL